MMPAEGVVKARERSMGDGWEFQVNTGNPDADRQTIAGYEQQYRPQGMTVSAEPLAAGGFMVRIKPAAKPGFTGAGTMMMQQAPEPPAPAYGAPPPQQEQVPPPQQQYGAPQQQYGAPQQQQYGAPQQQQYAGGHPAYAMAGGGAMAGAGAVAMPGVLGEIAPPIAADRLRYLRKVYALLGASAFIAVACGWLAVSVGPTIAMTSPEGHPAEVPLLVGLMLGNDILLYGAFGLLVLATFVASWVSKVQYVNIAALFGVAALMGIELAPMAFVAQFYAGMGETMSANPVRDTFMMVFAVFFAITAYIFVARKDFSWLGSILSMGFFVILTGCVLTFFLDSEPFALAIATGGAILSIGFLLYVTSYIFRNSDMDDPVGDALAMLVQLRNLFMFLLRIFMSRR
jgi:FtsH-binding integral membrane protein